MPLWGIYIPKLCNSLGFWCSTPAPLHRWSEIRLFHAKFPCNQCVLPLRGQKPIPRVIKIRAYALLAASENTLQQKILSNNWPYGDRTGFSLSTQTVLDTTTSFGWTSLGCSMCRTSLPWLSASRLSTLPRVLFSSSSSSRLTRHTVANL